MKTTLFLFAFLTALGCADLKAQVGYVQDSTGIFAKNENLYVKGQFDAERYYAKYKPAGTGTLIASLVSPLIGLVPAISTSATPPQIDNLGYPDPNLIKQQEYYLGYTQKAKKIKQRKVWTNWGIGFGVNLAAILIIGANSR